MFKNNDLTFLFTQTKKMRSIKMILIQQKRTPVITKAINLKLLTFPFKEKWKQNVPELKQILSSFLFLFRILTCFMYTSFLRPFRITSFSPKLPPPTELHLFQDKNFSLVKWFPRELERKQKEAKKGRDEF